MKNKIFWCEIDYDAFEYDKLAALSRGKGDVYQDTGNNKVSYV